MKDSSQKSLVELCNITDVILKKEIDYIALKNALDALKALFLEASNLNMEADVNSEHIYTSSGKAIGLKWAAMCIEDLIRTKQFISGIHKAILDKQLLKKSEPIQILYTGTGPFATLVMPFITKFTSEEIQFTCLEINPNSIQSLKNVIEAFGAGAYFKEIHQCDASQFKITEGDSIDIVIIEVLQLALTREPQVAITFNLLPQLSKEVTLIPEEISLQVALLNSTKQQEHLFSGDPHRKIDFLKIVEHAFTLNKAEINSKKTDIDPLVFSEKEILFSKEELEAHTSAVILTEITVYDTFKLGFRDSGLTIPSIFADLSHEKNLKGVKTEYLATNDPYLHTSLIR